MYSDDSNIIYVNFTKPKAKKYTSPKPLTEEQKVEIAKRIIFKASGMVDYQDCYDLYSDYVNSIFVHGGEVRNLEIEKYLLQTRSAFALY